MLKIVDRYLIREFAMPLGFGVGMFSMLIVTTVILTEALRFIQRYNLPPVIIFKYIGLAAPEFIVLSIPMGTLLGALLAVGRLNADQEIIAMRACGLSLYRVLAPFLVVGALLAGVTLLGTEKVVPLARQKLLALKNNVFGGKMGSRQRLLIPIRESGQLRWVLSAAELDGDTLRDVDLLYFDPKSEYDDFAIRAARATWEGNHWRFYDMRQTKVQSSVQGDELVTVNTRELNIPDFDIQPVELTGLHQVAEDVSALDLRPLIEKQLKRLNNPQDDSGLLRMQHDIREAAANAVQQDRTVVPVYEAGALRWLLIAGSITDTELRNVKLFSFDPEDESQDFTVTAARAAWNGGKWLFYDMRKVKVNPEQGSAQVIEEEKTGEVPQFNLSPQSLELRIQTDTDMDALQLRQRIAELRTSTDLVDRGEIRDLRTKLYFKYTIPLTPVFFIWVAFPLAISSQRTSNARGMGIALLLVLGYYALYSTFQRLGAVGAIPPPLAAWAPNILLGTAGWLLMRKRERN